MHIECFRKWGKNKCELCDFRFYAGEPPVAEPNMRPRPIGNNNPMNFNMNDNIAEIDINLDMIGDLNFNLGRNDEDLMRNLVNRYVPLMVNLFFPEADQEGRYRSRTFMEKFLKFEFEFIFKGLIFSVYFKFLGLLLWHVREVAMSKFNKTLSIQLVKLTISSFSLFTITVITYPVFFIYYSIKYPIINLSKLFVLFIAIDFILKLLLFSDSESYFMQYLYPLISSNITNLAIIIQSNMNNSLNTYTNYQIYAS